MTESQAKKTQYAYNQNSNLVIQGTGGGKKGENDPNGEGDTLAGKKLAQFGDLAQREKPQELKKLREKQQKKEEEKKRRQARGDILNPNQSTRLKFGATQNNILDLNIEEQRVYKPKTKDTLFAYEQILYLVKTHADGQSEEYIKDSVDEVLATLKSEGLKDFEKKSEIEALFQEKITDEEFNKLTVLAQELVDYNPELALLQKQGGREEEIQANFMHDSDMEDDDGDDDVVQDVDDQGNFGNEDDNIEDEVVPDNDEEDEDGMQIDTQTRQRKGRQVQDESFLDLNDIDAQWLNRILLKYFQETKAHEEIQVLEQQVLTILGNVTLSKVQCERELIKKLQGEYDLLKLLNRNRFTIYFCTKINQTQNKQEKDLIYKELEQNRKKDDEIDKLYKVLVLGQGDKENDLLKQADTVTKQYQELSQQDMQDILQKQKMITDEDVTDKAKQNKYLDLENLYQQQEIHYKNENKKCTLPKGTKRFVNVGYEEILVPAVTHIKDENEKLIPITDLPEWAQAAFPDPIKNLNQIQSRLYKSAFQSNENLLVCAPTGAGKTNIALLTILQAMGQKRRTDGSIDYRSFKAIYIAPMKALVTEIVGNFSKRLDKYGLKIRELTGDVHLTKSEIDDTQIIVTTPEKWDIITRKSGDRAYLDLVKLIIIDEIHLLHDLRGPVLESIVARTIRQIEQTQELIRIVALSATLPNYTDVAAFLRVNQKTGLYHFNNTYRPVPLEQIYVGITEKKSLKRMMLMNEICYEKIIQRVQNYQILVFVHSRKETVRTAKIIRDYALAKDQLHLIQGNEMQSKEILQDESKLSKSQDLKDLLPYGIGIHNAGLDRKDRLQVENLFASNHLKVLVSTATLAWGVNLPAHTVIIKGTQIYSPEQGKWVELSSQDMLQMIGRAGRPQYDKSGEGIIITNFSELQYYLSLNNQQMPIESQLISQLADQLNAEVVLGTITNTKEAINWLAYTYLYVRMLKSPEIYGIDADEIASDPHLIQRRLDLIHSAALQLQKANMIKYERKTGVLQSTAIGKVASHYYIKYNSMGVYNENLKPHMNLIDLFRLFSLSKEFQFIPIRETERLELQKFIDRVPIPVKGSLEEASTKINILLQAYITKFRLDGYDLNADMVYVTQSAGRIMRAIFDISLKQGWAQVAESALNLSKMVEKRMWTSMTPLRQYKNIPEDILRKIEKKEQFTWSHYYGMTPQQIGEIIKAPKAGKLIHKLIHQFPRIELEAFIQPITSTIIKIELALTPDFEWEKIIHGQAEPFLVFVLDGDQEKILHYEYFILKQKHMGEQHILTFTVPLFKPMPPQYFIKVVSDRWIQSETTLSINFKHLILPELFQPPVELLDLHPRLLPELSFDLAEKYFGKFQGGMDSGSTEFNPIQTQAFSKLYQSDESVFVGAPTGSKNIVCGELALFRELKQNTENVKIVYICPVESLCKIRYKKWHQYFSQQEKTHEVKFLCGPTTNTQIQDVKEVQTANIIVASPERWDGVSRKWKQRQAVKGVTLYILDEIHLISEYATYEVVASRIRYMQSEIGNIRIIALSTSLANAKDVSNWLGIPFPANTFNFHPDVRPTPLQIQFQGFDHNNRATRILAMEKPAYNFLKKNITPNSKAQGIVFVSDRKQARMTSLSLITFVSSDENPYRFLNRHSHQKIDDQKWDVEFYKKNKQKIKEETLLRTLEHGIGSIHDGLSESEINYIKHLYQEGIIRVLVVIESKCWEISDLQSHLIIILDVEKYDGQQKRYVEYQLTDVLQMMGIANKQHHKSQSASQASKCIMFCHTPKKDFYIKFLQEPLPIESSLESQIHDHLNASIVAQVIKTKQDAVDWITWTFLYRRISQNPNYYNITGKTGQHINDFLSTLIEQTVEQLQQANCIEVKGEEEMDLEPGNLGHIAAFYGIKYQTMQLFSQELGSNENGGASKKLKDLIRVLAMSSEFEDTPIRQSEDKILKSLINNLTYPIEGDDQKYNVAHNKTIILLQCHFNRVPLPLDFRIDQKIILEKSVKLIHAMVDVLSSEGFLKPCLVSLGLCQMIVQAMWQNQNPLLQLPFFDQSIVSNLKKYADVSDIADFMNMEDEQRNKLVKVSEQQLQEIAQVCNRYPYVNMQCKVLTQSVQDGDSAQVEIKLERANIEDEEELAVFQKPVYAQYYPSDKEEQWWIIIGDNKENKLLAIKKLTLKDKNTSVKLQFEAGLSASAANQNQGNHTKPYMVYLFCDSYIGCDSQEEIHVKIEK